jgi:hypothetical protein
MASGPVEMEGRRGAAQAGLRAVLVGLRHDAEQPGTGGLQGIGDGKVGRQRQRRVALFRQPSCGRSAR